MTKKQMNVFIFDLDGTLIDSRQDLANAVNHTRDIYGLGPVETDLVAGNIGHGVKNLLRKTIPELDPTGVEHAINSFKTYYQSHCVDETCVYPGIIEILNHFKDKKKAVVSNKPYAFTLKILQERDLFSFFDIVLGEDSYPKKKPDPAPLLYVMEKLGGTPSTSCMVGDYITDIEAGKRAGMATVGCLYGIGRPEEVRAFQPDYLVESIIELKNLFQ